MFFFFFQRKVYVILLLTKLDFPTTSYHLTPSRSVSEAESNLQTHLFGRQLRIWREIVCGHGLAEDCITRVRGIAFHSLSDYGVKPQQCFGYFGRWEQRESSKRRSRSRGRSRRGRMRRNSGKSRSRRRSRCWVG